ncbi:hypothetical protein KBY89_36830, partial [Streptomyces sp. RK74B]|uniref:hypothetical protein n=1 Tax=Streptomyces sp. RK74B TaxID=2824894 RepID=UPI001B39717F
MGRHGWARAAPRSAGLRTHPRAGLGAARRGGRRVGALAGAGRVPLRPPLPPQRHDCPQLGWRWPIR